MLAGFITDARITALKEGGVSRQPYRSSGIEREDPGQLPSTDDQISHSVDLTAEIASPAKRQHVGGIDPVEEALIAAAQLPQRLLRDG